MKIGMFLTYLCLFDHAALVAYAGISHGSEIVLLYMNYLAEEQYKILPGREDYSYEVAVDCKGSRPGGRCTLSELIAAGADPTAATAEGLVPLHIAARARESNIVGILLDAVQAKGPQEAAAAICARDEIGWQPLHYACRSGRPETVALFLEDAASRKEEFLPTLSSLLDACAEYAQEQPLWETYRRPDINDFDAIYLCCPIEKGWKDDVSGGTGRLDKLRPWATAGPLLRAAYLNGFASDEGIRRRLEDLHRSAEEHHCPELVEEEMNGFSEEEYFEKERTRVDYGFNNASGGIRSEQDTTQVWSILQMVHKAFPSTSLFLQTLRGCIQKLEGLQPAKKTETENETSGSTSIPYMYTLHCFNEFASALDKDLQKLLTGLGTPMDSNQTIPDTGFLTGGKRVVECLLRQHNDAIIPLLLVRWASDRLPDSDPAVTTDPKYIVPREVRWATDSLRRLVELGQAELLAETWACSPGFPIFDKPEMVGTTKAQPLLFLACCRELPNMDVVRLLVETYHVDINGRSMTKEEFEKARTEPQPEIWNEDDADPGHATALHELARGRHWWGVAQGIPYLLAHGADLTVTNEDGQTPLDVARDYLPQGPFYKEVLELLEKASSR